ncbi:MAG: flavodoxin [Intestinibacter bartlettii]|uniref:flavodoxin n=1 Tax=Intestinibacter bartlettii TaxID=261299 RepID=UPI0026F1B884|nr:flavodoxin [Intestinibacter bartlettii]MDO5009402.1 flavodoxin [Intestinibacter bartlettii]
MANKSLVTYFSASGVTEKVAEKLAEAAGADIFEIKPEVAYTSADLNWMDKKSRSSVEMNDKSFRPAIAEKCNNIADYDVVYVGFPIWWYVAPTIINTFLESYDFSGKTIVLFATSGGSGFGKTVSELKGSVSDTTVIKEGKVFNSGISKEQLLSWVNSLGL